VQVEKRQRNTEEVARALARAARVPVRDVGYAGRKDRVAVARQWFSVPELDPARLADLDLGLSGVRLLAAERHPHKLRTGQLRGNRFEIRVRNLGGASRDRALAALEDARRVGLPNRFGAQRFGRDGDNCARALELLRADAPTPRRAGRRQARFWISALQAAVFNRVLTERPLPLEQVERGELAVVHESGGLFQVEDEARENARAERFEISATGPIFGTRTREPSGPALRREREALAALGVPEPGELRPPRGVRLRGSRRSLRMRPSDVDLEVEGEALRLGFFLPAGGYATVLLEEIFGELASGPDDKSFPEEVC
jgi:tRNA pseudouridine13 synthase